MTRRSKPNSEIDNILSLEPYGSSKGRQVRKKTVGIRMDPEIWLALSKYADEYKLKREDAAVELLVEGLKRVGYLPSYFVV